MENDQFAKLVAQKFTRGAALAEVIMVEMDKNRADAAEVLFAIAVVKRFLASNSTHFGILEKKVAEVMDMFEREGLLPSCSEEEFELTKPKLWRPENE